MRRCIGDLSHDGVVVSFGVVYEYAHTCFVLYIGIMRNSKTVMYSLFVSRSLGVQFPLTPILCEDCLGTGWEIDLVITAYRA